MTTPANTASARERGLKSEGLAWCWQEKEKLRGIGESFAESNQATSARSIYLALTEIASDQHKETFQATIGLIAHKAGVSHKTAITILHSMDQFGFIKIHRNSVEGSKMLLPNSYTLLTNLPPSVTITQVGQPLHTLCNDGQTNRPLQRELKNSEESIKNKTKIGEELFPAIASPSTPSKKSSKSSRSVDEIIQGLQAKEVYSQINVRLEFQKAEVWYQARNQQVTEKKLINWLNKAEQPLTRSNSTTTPKEKDYANWS